MENLPNNYYEIEIPLNESETIKFKKTQIGKYQKDNNCKSYQLIALII